MNAAEPTFWDAVDAIREKDAAYRREAYGFVVASLGEVVESLPQERRADPARRHLDGRELLEGIVRRARREFGTLGATVFSEWGIRTSGDVGRIVFQLVESGQLSARPEDRIEDFERGPDLLRALARDTDPGTPRT